jgi:6-phosphofructokinase 2
MKPVVTLTMNPALDMSTSVERVESRHKLRCGPAVFDPGGGGVNVARVIHRLGGEAMALYPCGGPTGHAYRQLLEAEGVDARAIPIEGATRSNVTVDETSTGEQYRFVVQGPEISEAEWRHCLDVLAERVEADGYVVASGSLPPGVPDDFYRRVARLAKARGARCVIDTSGAPLRAALEEGVFLVKPNLREMQQLTGKDLDAARQQEQAARELVERGASEIVALTLGADGAVLAWSGGLSRVLAPRLAARSAVGAGDSFVGALVLRLAQGRPLEEAFLYASAAGAAALLTPATELCRRDDVERLYRQIAEAQASHGV